MFLIMERIADIAQPHAATRLGGLPALGLLSRL